MRQPQLFPIPAGAAPSRCSAPQCGAKLYRVRSPSGKSQPLAIAERFTYKGETIITGASEPTATEPGQGYSHFIDCLAAPSFRR